MSSQKGNVSRSRGQKHQNATAFQNDRYGATTQLKRAKSKLHDGLCQHCKDVLEWKIKYNKYKPLTQPRKCVKCSQKTVKDAYHIICKACSLQLEICCKCGKKEDIVIPVNSHLEDKESEEEGKQTKEQKSRREKDSPSDDDDDDDDEEEEDDLGDLDDEADDLGQKTQQKSAALPDVSRIKVKN